ncbi:MAG: transglutaminase-like domain-containing protein [Desulfatiglandales bacterium]
MFKAEKEEAWYEIFMEDKKIGYKREELVPFEYGHLIKEETFLKLKAINVEQEIIIRSKVVTDKSFLVKDFYITIQSGAISAKIRGEVKDKLIKVVLDAGNSKKDYQIQCELPFYLGNTSYIYKNLMVQGGQEQAQFAFLNPFTMKIETMWSQMKGKEIIDIRGVKKEATLFYLEYGGLSQKVFLDERGRILREEGLMGFRIERAEGPSAMSGITPSEDLAFVNSVEPKGKKISQPQRITGLKISSNIDGIPEDGRQKIQGKEISISVEPIPSSFMERSVPGDIGVYLRASPGIEADHPRILQVAQMIRGGEEDLVIIARRTLSFVYSKLEKRPVLSFPSAVATLETLVGDCTEHATLLTALLRANRIPARVVGGLTFQEGRFFYHAWTEAYLGQWVSMDPTLNQMPCDGTHIKLFYFDQLLDGSSGAIKFLSSQLGKLKIEILDFTYD